MRWYLKRLLVIMAMFSVLLFILATAFLALGYKDIQPPIPLLPKNPGFVLGNGSQGARIKIEVFLDLNCGDSAAAWQNMKALVTRYQSTDLVVIAHLTMLPYHRFSFMCAEGFYLVSDKTKAPDAIVRYVDTVFAKMSYFLSVEADQRTYEETLAYLSDQALAATGITRNEFMLNIKHYAAKARSLWKYSVKRGAAGAPWYYINGVDLGLNSNKKLAYEDLVGVIDELKGSSEL